jgi:alanyl-tRNA synthetase
MTERLHHHDSYLTEFRARIVERAADGCRLYLDRTAFYPTSGGQPHDTGSIAGVPVIDVVDEDDRILHVTAQPVAADEVDCLIDWRRRFDHMQQHSGQHLLSAVLVELYSIATVGFHLGEENSTIDVATAALDSQQVARIVQRANEVVFENRPLSVSFEQNSDALDLRKPSEREGLLRIVSIADYDHSACGGTHVRATGEIGPILVRKLEKIRNTVRIEFLCGNRAVRRAQADYEALSKIGRLLSAQLDETPAMVAGQIEVLRAGEKARRQAAIELAQFRGRDLYASTPPDAQGVRRVVQRTASGAIDDELRALAQSFTAQSKALFVALVEQPPALLLAVSKDLGINAGDMVKSAVTRAGGRGGGNPSIAQGTVPSKDVLEALGSQLSLSAL